MAKVELRGCVERGSCYKPPEQEATARRIDAGLFAGRERFVILAQATIASQPGKRPFHHPAPLQDAKATWQLRRVLPRRHPDVAQPRLRMLHYLDPPAQLRLDRFHEAPFVAAIDPDERQPP